jgi:DnaJ family protein C protein 2
LDLACCPNSPAHPSFVSFLFLFVTPHAGFDVLTNPSTRIDYDSMYEVDDDIPGPKEGAGDIAKFLAVYGPVFARNARFSTVKPVPLIGNADTPYAEVEKFYLFWGNFKSWREFASGDTDKCGDSASRDERRRAAQKNKKQREVLKKEELGRIRKLMTQAQAIDPRVVAHKSAIANNKSAAKNAAADAKRIAAEEAKRAVDEAKKAAEEAAAKAKQAADEARRKAADLSNKIRKFRAVFNREPELSGEEGLVNQMLKIMELPEGIVIDKALKAAGVVVDANGFGGDVVGKVACLECVKALADRARPLLVKA